MSNKRFYNPALITFLLYAISCIYAIQLHAQQLLPGDTQKVDRLLTKIGDSAEIAPGSLLPLDSTANSMAKQLNYKRGIARSLLVRGVLYARMHDGKDAIEWYNKAIQAADDYNLSKTKANALNNRGIAYCDMGESDSCIESITEAYKIHASRKDTASMATSYFALANCLGIMKYYDEANTYYAQTLVLYYSRKDSFSIATVYHNMAANFMNQGKYDTATKYLFKSIAAYKRFSRTNPDTYLTLGACYQEKGKLDSAIMFFSKAMDIAKAISNKHYIALVSANMGGVYADEGKLDDAEKYLKVYLDNVKENSDRPNIIIADNQLADVYSRKGDYKNAFLLKADAYNQNDSLLNNEKIKAVAQMSVRFKTEQAEEKNAELLKENDLQNVRLQRKNIIIAGLSATFLLLLVIGILLIRQNKLRAKNDKAELEHKQFLAQINPHFIFNCLNSIQYFIVKNDVKNANKYLSDFASLMRLTLDNSTEDKICLNKEIDYLKNYLSLESMRFESKFEYSITPKDGVDANEMKIPPMIIQPFVENAIRHGFSHLKDRTGKLTITFYAEGQSLFCEIDDNGIGREQSYKLKRQENDIYQVHGIELTKQRLVLLNRGKDSAYDIQIMDKKGSSEQQGTTVRIKFPLEV